MRRRDIDKEGKRKKKKKLTFFSFSSCCPKNSNQIEKIGPDAPLRGPDLEGDPPRQHRHVAGVLEGAFFLFRVRERDEEEER